VATILKQLTSTPQPDGTTATAANTSYTSLTPGSGNTHVHADAAKMGAGAGFRMTQAGATQNIAYVDLDANVDELDFRIEFKWAGTLTQNTTIGRAYSDVGHLTVLWSFLLTTTGRLQFLETGTSPLNVTSPSTNGLNLFPGTEYVLMGQVNTVNKTLTLDCYIRTSTTKLFQLTGALVNTVAMRSFR